MELEKINEICYRIMSFYDYNLRCKKSQSTEAYQQMEMEYANNIFQMKKEVTEQVIKKIGKNYRKYPDIFNYCVVFKPDLVNYNTLVELLYNNCTKGYLNILMMDKRLDDDVVSFILYKLSSNKYYQGEIPYDYRYYILKRREISKYVKENILKSYSEDELENTIFDIKYDLVSELEFNNIKTKSDLLKHDDLYGDYMVLKKLKKYLRQKVHKK